MTRHSAGRRVSHDGGTARLRAADRAYQYLRRRISEGFYEPGCHLKEEDVAVSLGVSRTPVREAIRRLDADGWIQVIPNRGAFVTGWPETDLNELFRLRAVLEAYGARLAATRIEPATLELLESLAGAMEALPGERDIDEVWELNDRFHKVVMEASGNHRLVSMHADIAATPLVRRSYRRYTDAYLQASFLQHREIIAALAAGDPEWAGYVMSAHVLGGQKVFGLPAVDDAADLSS